MKELEDVKQFEAWLADGSERPAAACQALNLVGYDALKTECFAGSLFLGCELEPDAAANLVSSGALVLSNLGKRPYKIHRKALYCPHELFSGYDPQNLDGYRLSLDYEVYDHYLKSGKQYPPSIAESLSRRLHDHSISDALHEFIHGKRVVAIMGGHGLERRDPEYRTVARIARRLTLDGYLMASGGGPGAMEACHLGAWFAHFDEKDLDRALETLGVRWPDGKPGKEYADKDWLKRAWAVWQKWPVEEIKYESVGIPTWLYGHEPPTLFATHIAKYFANSVREEGLLEIAKYGVVYAKGSAGTTQEIFQDATQNHYGNYGYRSPMILLGRQYWSEERPVWPLLQKVAQGQIYDELLFLTDSEEAVIRRIQSYSPEVYKVESGS